MSDTIVPVGTTVVSAPIILQDGDNVIGSDEQQCILQRDPSLRTPCIIVGGVGCSATGFTLDGNSSSFDQYGIQAIVSQASQFVIDSVTIKDFQSGCLELGIDQCSVQNCNLIGQLLDISTGTGIKWSAGAQPFALTVSNCVIKNHSQFGIDASGGVVNLNNNLLQGNYVYSTADGSQIRIGDSIGTLMSALLNNNTLGGVFSRSLETGGIDCLSGTIEISNNSISLHPRYGIRNQGAVVSNTIHDNQIFNNGMNVSGSDPQLRGAIIINQGSDSVDIYANHAYDSRSGTAKTQTWAVMILGGATNLRIASGNDFSGNINDGPGVTNTPTAALTSQFLAPLTPRWVEFPTYDSAVPNGVFFTEVPTFDPPAGGYATTSYPLDVTISTETTGATISWTTDGSQPTPTNGNIIPDSSTVASVPLTTPPTVLKAMAFRDGLTNSAIISGAYTKGTVANPTFDPEAGTYPSTDYPKAITISTLTDGASIRFTKNGTDPTPTSGTIYNDTNPPTVAVGDTLKAIAYETGYNPSQVTSGHYLQFPAAAEPTFDPESGGVNTFPFSVQMSTSTSGASIRYTLNDSDLDDGLLVPNNSGAQVSAPGDVLRARAEQASHSNSTVHSGTYTQNEQQVDEPTLDPDGYEGTSHTVNVLCNCSTPGVTMAYEIGTPGSTPNPTHNSTHIANNGIINLTIGHKEIKIIAFVDGMTDSPIHVADYNFNGS